MIETIITIQILTILISGLYITKNHRRYLELKDKVETQAGHIISQEAILMSYIHVMNSWKSFRKAFRKSFNEELNNTKLLKDYGFKKSVKRK